MTTSATSWQVFLLLTLLGAYLGMLGLLYVAYDLLGRRTQVLHRCVWVFSSGFLVASILLASYLFPFGVQRLTSGYSLGEVWRFGLVLSAFGFLMQQVFFSPPPQARPPVVTGRDMVFPIAFSSVLLVGGGAVIAPQGSNPIEAVIFALPGILVLGTLNGCSPAIQWWVLHLPEKRIAVIGTLLIFCAFALVVIQSLLKFLGILL